jgi:hypothetical protein
MLVLGEAKRGGLTGRAADSIRRVEAILNFEINYGVNQERYLLSFD